MIIIKAERESYMRVLYTWSSFGSIACVEFWATDRKQTLGPRELVAVSVADAGASAAALMH